MLARFFATLFAASLLVTSVHAQPQAKPRLDSLGDPLPEGAVTRLGSLRLQHDPNRIFDSGGPVWSPHGKIIAAFGNTGRRGYKSTISFWNSSDGKKSPGLWNFQDRAHTSNVAFSPDGKLFLDSYVGKDLRFNIDVWDVAQGKLLRNIYTGSEHHDFDVLAWPVGNALICRCDRLLIWLDLGTAKILRIWKPDLSELRKAEPSAPKEKWEVTPNGTHLLVKLSWPVTREKRKPTEIRAFDLANGNQTWGVTLGEFGGDTTFSGDGKRIAIMHDAFQVEIRDVSTGKVLGIAPLDPKAPLIVESFRGASSIALSPDGNSLAIGFIRFAFLWDLNQPTKLRTLRTRRYDSEQQLAFSPDGKDLAIWMPGNLSIYDVATLEERLPGNGHRAPVDHLKFSADGMKLISTSFPGAIFRSDYPDHVQWDAATWRQSKFISALMAPWPVLFQASPDGTLYFGDARVDHFAYYDLATGKLKGRLSGVVDQNSWSGCFSRGGHFYLLDDRDKQGKRVQRLFAMPSGKHICDLPIRIWGHWQSGYFGDFSSDGRILAAFGDEDRLLRVFETATGKLIGRYGEQLTIGRSVFFSPHTVFSWDGKLLACWDPWNAVEKGVRVWNIATGKHLLTLPAAYPYGESGANVLAWSPDSRTMAVSEGSKIRLWELSTQKIRLEFSGHAGSVTALAFSPEGRFLASGSADTTVLIWDLWDR